jgi:hypothetical protein
VRQVAELEQPDAELVGALFDPIHHPRGDQVVEDAMSGGRMQAGALGEILQADWLGPFGQGVEQADHAVDDLDGCAAGVGCYGV